MISVLFRRRFFLLLLSLLLYLITIPLAANSSHSGIFLNILVSLTLLFGVVTLFYEKKRFGSGLFLLSPYFISIWLNDSPISFYATFAGKCFGIAFYLFLTYLLIKFITRQKKVDMELIFASLSGYLLLGLAWAIIYSLIYSLDPASIVFPISSQEATPYNFIYFSFVTLTSLGYGDISPISSVAQSWAIIQAVIGQIYMVVIVAGLVGIFISNNR